MKDNFNEDYFGPDNDYEEQAASDELENFKITWRDNSLFRFFKRQKCEAKIFLRNARTRFIKWFLYELRYEPSYGAEFAYTLCSIVSFFSFKQRVKIGFVLFSLFVISFFFGVSLGSPSNVVTLFFFFLCLLFLCFSFSFYVLILLLPIYILFAFLYGLFIRWCACFFNLLM